MDNKGGVLELSFQGDFQLDKAATSTAKSLAILIYFCFNCQLVYK